MANKSNIVGLFIGLLQDAIYEFFQDPKSVEYLLKNTPLKKTDSLKFEKLDHDYYTIEYGGKIIHIKIDIEDI